MENFTQIIQIGMFYVAGDSDFMYFRNLIFLAISNRSFVFIRIFVLCSDKQRQNYHKNHTVKRLNYTLDDFYRIKVCVRTILNRSG